MNFKEFGKGNKNAVMLLHGGGLSWWNYREEAELLSEKFRVILPILDGHAGSDAPFTSIEANAAELISFIDSELGGRVMLIGGLSLGGQVLLEMLTQRNDICRYALIESASVIPSGFESALIEPTFGLSWGIIKNRSFAKLQFKSLNIRQELFEDYYRDTCLIKKSDMAAFMRASTLYELKGSVKNCAAKTRVFIGGKEVKRIRRSAGLIMKAIPGCALETQPGYRHGELSLNRPKEYAELVERIVEEREW